MYKYEHIIFVLCSILSSRQSRDHSEKNKNKKEGMGTEKTSTLL